MPFPDFAGSGATSRRVFFILFIIAIQAIVLKFTVHPWDVDYARGYYLLGRSVQPTVYFILAFSLLLSTHWSTFWRALINHARDHGWRRLVIPQAVCYFLVIYSAGKLMPTDFFAFTGTPEDHAGWWELLLAASVLATAICSLGVIAPKAYWMHFAKTEKATLLLAFVFAVTAFVLGSLFQQSWDILNGPTMKASKFFLDLVYDDVRTDPHRAILGTENFIVTINYLCSGYEGMGMITVFLTWYLMNFKNDLKFPAAFLLFPVGITVIWLFNSLRLALLIGIGSSISPNIAMDGFHSNAGWISFIAVALGVILVARKSSFFSKSVIDRQIVLDPVTASAIPFLVMLAATLISSSLSTRFPWLYPVRVIATGLAILLLWKHLDLKASAPRLFPILAGVFVFFLWIALVAPSLEKDREFAETLFGVSGFLSIGWIIIRMLGSVIVIPIAEELAFRRYVLSFFPGRATHNETGMQIQWLAMLVSSVLFGALHSSWIAGTLAGCIYYFVQLRSGRLWDAVVAHMTTNLLLSAYVLLYGHWSYW